LLKSCNEHYLQAFKVFIVHMSYLLNKLFDEVFNVFINCISAEAKKHVTIKQVISDYRLCNAYSQISKIPVQISYLLAYYTRCSLHGSYLRTRTESFSEAKDEHCDLKFVLGIKTIQRMPFG
jgi:hypothetical protein